MDVSFMQFKQFTIFPTEKDGEIFNSYFIHTDQDKELVRKYILNCFNRFLKNSKTKFTLDTITLN